MPPPDKKLYTPTTEAEFAADFATLRKIRSLIDRAVHPTTPEEEARTAAMAACKLIAENDCWIAANYMWPGLEAYSTALRGTGT